MSTFKLLLGGSAAVLTGLMGLTYTDPARTRRKFDASLCPPLKFEQARTRHECLEQLQSHSSPEHPLDMLVIGGGTVGAGVTVDAVTRGLSVGMVEMGDYAGETSSRSTKLIHGGIRYLQKAVFQLDPMQLRLVSEALRERSILIHQAPHLCHGLATLVPCYSVYDAGLFWLGTKAYDMLAAMHGGTIEYSGFIGPYKTMDLYPKLRKTDDNNRALLGSVRYFDGQLNDARMCFEVTMTASCYGAATVNYARVDSTERVKNAQGEELVKTTVTDLIGKQSLDVYSKCIVNATGPFAGSVQKMVLKGSGGIENVPALGTHIIIDRSYCPKNHEALVVPSSDGRVVFTIPWLGGCLIGTTDRRAKIQSNPHPTDKDVHFLLKEVEPYIGNVPESALRSSWAGIRPLAKLTGRSQGSTQNMVREHLIVVDKDALMVNVTGGKWTTYREMAEQTVDRVRDTVLKGRVEFKECITPEIVMASARNLSQVPTSAPSDGSIAEDVHRHWINNYGNKYNELMALAKKDNFKYAKRLQEGGPVVEAEVLWSAMHEHCEHVTDFLCRRTRMAFVNSEQAVASIPRVAELMAVGRNWSKSRVKEEKAAAYAYMAAFKGLQ